MSHINSYITSQQYQGLKKDTTVSGFYIEDFCIDYAGNVWVKAIPETEFNKMKKEDDNPFWYQEQYDLLIRVFLIPRSLKGHWRYNQ